MKYSASSVWENKDEYDVVVVGAGHAGCEAALATARLGSAGLCQNGIGDSDLYGQCGQYCADAMQSEYRRKLKGASGQRVGCTWRRDGKSH